MHFDARKDIRRIVIIILCAFIMSLNIKTFVRTGDLFPGGATGLTILIQQVAAIYFHVHLPYTLINVLLNAFPIYIGFRYIGKKFTLFSCLMIVLSSVLTDLIPAHVLTQDILLISIFGGMINGFVISMCLMADATTGGTDFIGIYLSDKKGMDAFNLVLALNAVILCTAGLLFGWDKALYSIIFQYASTQVLHGLYKRYQKGTLFIVTNLPREVCAAISTVSHHGATILEGEGSHDHCERNVVYSVVSSQESHKVIKAVKAVDPAAFVNMVKTQEVAGRFYYAPKD
ncbi:MAG: YitT family protein [Blautia sp.]|nr:YitT family protein [Blautia sp.]